MDCWLRDLFSRKVLNRDDLDNYLVQREIDVSFFHGISANRTVV